MKIGSHVSIREGYLGAAKMAYALGAQAYQYFPKNPRNLGVKAFDAKDAAACKAFCLEKGIVSIAHTPYPTNLCVDDPQLRLRTIDSIRNDLAIADACGSIGVVVHFGQYKGSNPDPLYGYQIMIQLLNELLRDWQGETKLLLENNAGQGGRMGITLEELTQIPELTQVTEKIGFCLDTCHLFAGGVWTGDNWPDVLKKGEELGYFQHLHAVHLNDSVYPSGSFRDRHASLGRGQIGEDALQTLLRTSYIQKVPIVLETPNTAGFTHRDELRLISQWLGL